MVYIDPRTGATVDTNDLATAQLVGLVLFLYYRSGAYTFARDNTSATIPELCRTLRARLFREGTTPHGRLRAALNSLDAPHCRCGRPGTRIIGGTTFCTRCGPNAHHREGFRKRHAAETARGVDIRQDRKERDASDLGHIRWQNNCAAAGKTR